MNEKEKLYDTLLQLGTALREKRAHVYGVGWDMHRKNMQGRESCLFLLIKQP